MVTRSASSIEDSLFSSSFCSGSYVTGLYLALAVVSICENLKPKFWQWSQSQDFGLGINQVSGRQNFRSRLVSRPWSFWCRSQAFGVVEHFWLYRHDAGGVQPARMPRPSERDGHLLPGATRPRALYPPQPGLPRRLERLQGLHGPAHGRQDADAAQDVQVRRGVRSAVRRGTGDVVDGRGDAQQGPSAADVAAPVLEGSHFTAAARRAVVVARQQERLGSVTGSTTRSAWLSVVRPTVYRAVPCKLRVSDSPAQLALSFALGIIKDSRLPTVAFLFFFSIDSTHSADAVRYTGLD